MVTATDIIKFFVVNKGKLPISELLAEPLDRIMTKKIIALPSNAPLRKAAELMSQERIGGLPLMSDGQLVGIITERDILALFPQISSKLLVQDIMTKRVIMASPNQTMFEAMKQMVSAGFRRIPITIEDDGLVGLVCAREFFHYLEDPRLKQGQEEEVFGTTIEDIMTTSLVCIAADAPLSEAASTMAWKCHGALPVTDVAGAKSRYGRLVGIITERDILRAVAKLFSGIS